MHPTASTIHYPSELRIEWPKPLARTWGRQYAHLFDRDDLRLALSQPRNHFAEWFTAIHLFHRDGATVLLEKYAYRNHDRKREKLSGVLSEQQLDIVDQMRLVHHVQPPDLFVFTPDKRFWFAEVKGPGDRLRSTQIGSHDLIRKLLRVPVEVFTVIAHNADVA